MFSFIRFFESYIWTTFYAAIRDEMKPNQVEAEAEAKKNPMPRIGIDAVAVFLNWSMIAAS